MQPETLRLVAAALVAATAVAAGCSGDDEPERWGGPGTGLGALAVGPFERHALDVDEPWERAPALAAAEFVRVDRAQARATSIAATTGPREGRGRPRP